MLHGSRSLVVPDSKHSVDPHFEQKFSMERRGEKKGGERRKMKSKMEGVIEEGNREQRRKVQ